MKDFTRVKILFVMFATVSSLFLFSCNSTVNPFSNKEIPKLFPISQNRKVGYINRNGEIVIQPQFDLTHTGLGFFTEGLAPVCISGKCGYVDDTGQFVINPQFESVGKFSEGLGIVFIEKKIGFVDKAGKIAINPQFEVGRGGIDETLFTSSFSENLASVKIGDKYGFINKEGKIVINPQFDYAFPFSDGLSAVSIGNKNGYVNIEGKIVINPQFDEAFPFKNGLAVIKVGEQYGYIDKEGKIAINPQFNSALSFSDEGLAWVTLGEKGGYIDKDGKYAINLQFTTQKGPNPWMIMQFLQNYRPQMYSFSEGLAPVMIGEKCGFIDYTGKIIINPQFLTAYTFEGGLAAVFTESGMAWIDKEGNYIWREIKESPKTSSNSSIFQSNTTTTVLNSMTANTTMNSAPQISNSSATSERTGRLTTDSNLRSEANKNSMSVGIHFKGAKITILDETSYMRDGGESNWYKVRVSEFGCSVDTNLGCGKNSSNDSDEGWVNAKNVLLD